MLAAQAGELIDNGMRDLAENYQTVMFAMTRELNDFSESTGKPWYLHLTDAEIEFINKTARRKRDIRREDQSLEE